MTRTLNHLFNRQQMDQPTSYRNKDSGQTLAVLAEYDDQTGTQVVTYTGAPFTADVLMQDFMGDVPPGPTSVVSPPLVGGWQTTGVSGSGTRIAVSGGQEISVWDWWSSSNAIECKQIGNPINIAVVEDDATTNVSNIILGLTRR
jgi:hypothetical protein